MDTSPHPGLTRYICSNYRNHQNDAEEVGLDLTLLHPSLLGAIRCYKCYRINMVKAWLSYLMIWLWYGMSTFSVLLLCILLIILMIFPNIQKLIGKFNIIIVCYNSNSSYNSLLIIYFLTFPSSEVLNFKGCWMSCKVLVWDQLGPSSRGHARELGVLAIG